MLGLRFCARAFSSCGERGPLLIAVRGPLTIAASLVAEHRLQTRRLSNCGSRAQLLCGMWDLPGPGLEPVSPALAGRLSTTAPPEKPHKVHFIDKRSGTSIEFNKNSSHPFWTLYKTKRKDPVSRLYIATIVVIDFHVSAIWLCTPKEVICSCNIKKIFLSYLLYCGIKITSIKDAISMISALSPFWVNHTLCRNTLSKVQF